MTQAKPLDLPPSLIEEAVGWRRDLHQHPELAYEETRTSALVAERLESFGFDEVATGLGKTGVVGVLHGEGGAPNAPDRGPMMLRADMDALPIVEESGARHASKTNGRMHACGHDGHTTMLLAAAKHLAETRNFAGTVYFCFQPAEEGGAGAQAMIDDGLFDRFPAERVFGMHNWPGMPVGQFGVRPGPMLASADAFEITLTGRGGHAAKPDNARDPIVAGAALVTALQTIVSREVDPLEPAVVSVCTFHGGTAFNIIPERVEIMGTVRSFSEATHAKIYDSMGRILSGIETTYRVNAALAREKIPYPPTINDAEAAAFSQSVLEDLAGSENVLTDFPPTMGAEDFSFMARTRPGCFIFTGNGDSASLHHPTYDFNDEAIPHGVAYWVRLVETGLPIAA